MEKIESDESAESNIVAELNQNTAQKIPEDWDKEAAKALEENLKALSTAKLEETSKPEETT